jgi:hypothetical protein
MSLAAHSRPSDRQCLQRGAWPAAGGADDECDGSPDVRAHRAGWCHPFKQRVEALTDELAARPYESLEPDELDELMATLKPLAVLLLAGQD